MQAAFDLESYRFFQQLKALPFVTKIILYGSRARGDNSARSDIDLAIETLNLDRSLWAEVWQIVESADTLLKIDCVHLNLAAARKNDPLCAAILRDGKILYRKEN